MTKTNAEVLGTIEATCLSPAAVERIVEGALGALTRPPEATAAREATLRSELAAIEVEIACYTTAVGQAPTWHRSLTRFACESVNGPRSGPS